MGDLKENIRQIGESINDHIQKELAGNYPNKAIARASLHPNK